ncbi:hypothetical protein ACWEKM_23280 [Streptomyces sp. NPDC004752]
MAAEFLLHPRQGDHLPAYRGPDSADEDLYALERCVYDAHPQPSVRILSHRPLRIRMP